MVSKHDLTRRQFLQTAGTAVGAAATPTFIGPETSMEIQATLGSDVAMLFDDCPPYPCDRAKAEESLDLTLHWAERCKNWIETNRPQAVPTNQLNEEPTTKNKQQSAF